MNTRFTLWALCACFLAGCAESPSTGPLVEVAGQSIEAQDLAAYRAKLPPAFVPKGDPATVTRQLLQSLVDREIMLLEARRLGYLEDPEFKQRRHKLVTQWLTQRVQAAEFGQALSVTDAELRKVYEKYHWNRKILPAHILSATEADARQIIRLLDEGADFHQLARERSLADDAKRGGFLGQYFGPDEAAWSLVQSVHGLPVGTYTHEPVHTRDGWEVVKVLDDQTVPLERVKPRLVRALHMEKFARERAEFIKRLEASHGVRYLSDAIADVVRAATQEWQPPAARLQAPAVLITDGPTIHLSEALRVTGPGTKATVADSLAVVRVLRGRLVADSLLVVEARARGLDKTPDFGAYAKQLTQRMLVVYLRKKQVLEHLKVTDDEITAEYERDPQAYFVPGRLDAQRALTETAAAGRDLVQAIEAGGDLMELARQRHVAAGHVHISESEPLYAHFHDAAAGAVVGPIQGESGFEVYLVNAVVPGRVRSLDEVAYIIRYRLKLRALHEAFEAYIEQLRQRYADQVTWHDERIREVANTGAE